MKPLFTIHAGEYIFGQHIEDNFKNARLWIPSKDTGIDFLISDSSIQSTVSIQVKMSKTYMPFTTKNKFDEVLTAGGWFVFSYEALDKSPADIWSLVLVTPERRRKPVFINIPPKILLNRLIEIHGIKKSYHLYPMLLKIKDEKLCLEGRGLSNREKSKLIDGQLKIAARDISKFEDNWSFLDFIH